MKMSVSNMAWCADDNIAVYKMMVQYGINGLEILPTKIIADSPYDHVKDILNWKKGEIDSYGFQIPSMQSIWYGQTENIFGTEEEQRKLVMYTKKAIFFAEAIGCRNLVFGCPKNRVMPQTKRRDDAILFFQEIADVAAEHNVVIGIEANPPIYQTNFINTTKEAVDLIDVVDRKSFMLNFDFGTFIENGEDLSILKGRVSQISHVHISEPNLKPIQKREEHKHLCSLLEKEGYEGYVSVEMGAVKDVSVLDNVLRYVRELVRG